VVVVVVREIVRDLHILEIVVVLAVEATAAQAPATQQDPAPRVRVTLAPSALRAVRPLTGLVVVVVVPAARGKLETQMEALALEARVWQMPLPELRFVMPRVVAVVTKVQSHLVRLQAVVAAVPQQEARARRAMRSLAVAQQTPVVVVVAPDSKMATAMERPVQADLASSCCATSRLL
jgi:hypothetical protein